VVQSPQLDTAFGGFLDADVLKTELWITINKI